MWNKTHSVIQYYTVNVTSSPRAVTLNWQNSDISQMTNKPSKLGQTDLVFAP